MGCDIDPEYVSKIEERIREFNSWKNPKEFVRQTTKDYQQQ